MKVFNLTDVETASLKQRGLVQHTFAVGPHLLAPGQSCDIDQAHLVHIRAGLQQLITFGALALGDQPPAAYTVAKAKAQPKPFAPQRDVVPARATPATPPPMPEDPTPEVKVPPPSRVPGSRKSRG